MRYKLIALSMLLGMTTITTACASGQRTSEMSVGIAYPGVSIGINMPAYPRLVAVPGYPVYYDPYANSNYFFYDGLYWVFYDDNWYASSWYNGPWDRIGYDYVPLYVLRVPVRYYRQPPAYFRGWRDDAPPRWGEHWGRDWEQRRSGWDQWDHRAVPAPAPLPVYQREYSGNRYPHVVEQQRSLQSEHYRYQPREPVTQQYYQRQEQPIQQRQQEQQHQQEQQVRQRQLDQQRQQGEQRQQDLQRQQEQQRQQERQIQRQQLDQERQQNQQRQQAQPRQQDQQRQLDQQRQQDSQRQQTQQTQQRQPDQSQQRSQGNPHATDQEDKPAPQDKSRKNPNEERDPYRQ